MYTGKHIELSDLFNNNLYDIDHVYPRHFVKDDNIDNNLVLVCKEKNAHKSDIYPLEDEILASQKNMWSELRRSGFITEEKYNRLIGRNSFTDEQKLDLLQDSLLKQVREQKELQIYYSSFYQKVRWSMQKRQMCPSLEIRETFLRAV